VNPKPKLITMKIIPVALIAFILLQSHMLAQPVKYLLHDSWKAKRVSDITLDGSVITGTDYKPEG
jgi:hypothetical protein